MQALAAYWHGEQDTAAYKRLSIWEILVIAVGGCLTLLSLAGLAFGGAW